MDNSNYHKKALIHVLHMAYSGEKAAGYAYNAHWRWYPCSSNRYEHQEFFVCAPIDFLIRIG